jgi:capsule polysaccharide export protein KpsE/RkpR
MKLLFVLCLSALISPLYCLAQKEQPAEAGPIRSSPAYAEVLLRKTEIQADLEALSAAYTETNPKILDLRSEQNSLDKMLEKIYGVKPSETGKLTLALGKLIVRKAALETEVSRLLRSYTKDQVEVKRAARRVEIFDAAISEILK